MKSLPMPFLRYNGKLACQTEARREVKKSLEVQLCGCRDEQARGNVTRLRSDPLGQHSGVEVLVSETTKQAAGRARRLNPDQFHRRGTWSVLSSVRTALFLSGR